MVLVEKQRCIIWYMEKINNNLYTLFIDESGVASLNHRGKVFILSCVIIKNSDIPIIQGYFQLLKREYFRNECKGIHCTDLFERTYKKYRKLMVPQDRRNSFLTRIEDTLKIVPFQSAIYYIDKDKLRNKIGYKPYGGKKSTTINYDLPYELVSRNALIDFSCFLASKKTTGEIVIESRQFSDQFFVSYFDDARKPRLKGGKINIYSECVKSRINSLSIANKDYIHTGLELADIGAYTTYRRKARDPLSMMKINISFSDCIHKIYKGKTLIKDSTNQKLIEVTEVEPQDVKPSKLI
ncbi:TPA: hypothetical protein DCP76_03020 [Patescibacteria group bacterium]|nr:hypothetical protein [Patescibacteria group bacterium]HAM96742.1 hypothetical protein [Patescibacteria group bacterium]